MHPIRSHRPRTAAGLALLALAGLAPASQAATTLVSAKADGTAADASVEAAVVSANGRWAAFSSTDALVPQDQNGKRDVYVRDLKTGALRLVSQGAAPSNGDADQSSNANGIGIDISVDGRFVVFDSEATNLIPGLVDDNNGSDVFRWDRKTGKIQLVSRAPDGSVSDGASRHARMSGDGRFVVFQSTSKDLTAIDPGANTPQVYVRNLKTGRTTFVSVAQDGTAPENFAERPDISADGRYVVFVSDATDIVAGDTNNTRDVFRRDLVRRKTERASRKADGTISDGFSDVPSISGNGRFVAFESDGVLVPTDTNNQRDSYVRDFGAGTTLRASLKDDDTEIADSASRPWISADGRRVAFPSTTNGITADDDNNVGDVFLRDLAAGTTLRLSATDAGDDAGGAASLPVLSGNGRAAAFLVEGTGKLLDTDTNDDQDAYVRTVATASDAAGPKIVFKGRFAVVGAERSGVALVTVNGVRLRIDAKRQVRVKKGQTIRVWDGAGNVTTRKRPK